MSYLVDKLIDANTLKQSNAQRKFIEEFIHDNILRINTSLKNAKHDGSHYIITELPIIFDIPNMDNRDAQRIIWSKTIEILKKKNYIVQINSTKDLCRLRISWVSSDEELQIKHQLQIINNNTGNF